MIYILLLIFSCFNRDLVHIDKMNQTTLSYFDSIKENTLEQVKSVVDQPGFFDNRDGTLDNGNTLLHKLVTSKISDDVLIDMVRLLVLRGSSFTQLNDDGSKPSDLLVDGNTKTFLLALESKYEEFKTKSLSQLILALLDEQMYLESDDLKLQNEIQFQVIVNLVASKRGDIKGISRVVNGDITTIVSSFSSVDANPAFIEYFELAGIPLDRGFVTKVLDNSYRYINSDLLQRLFDKNKALFMQVAIDNGNCLFDRVTLSDEDKNKPSILVEEVDRYGNSFQALLNPFQYALYIDAGGEGSDYILSQELVTLSNLFTSFEGNLVVKGRDNVSRVLTSGTVFHIAMFKQSHYDFINIYNIMNNMSQTGSPTILQQYFPAGKLLDWMGNDVNTNLTTNVIGDAVNYFDEYIGPFLPSGFFSNVYEEPNLEYIKSSKSFLSNDLVEAFLAFNIPKSIVDDNIFLAIKLTRILGRYKAEKSMNGLLSVNENRKIMPENMKRIPISENIKRIPENRKIMPVNSDAVLDNFINRLATKTTPTGYMLLDKLYASYEILPSLVTDDTRDDIVKDYYFKNDITPTLAILFGDYEYGINPAELAKLNLTDEQKNELRDFSRYSEYMSEPMSYFNFVFWEFGNDFGNYEYLKYLRTEQNINKPYRYDQTLLSFTVVKCRYDQLKALISPEINGNIRYTWDLKESVISQILGYDKDLWGNNNILHVAFLSWMSYKEYDLRIFEELMKIDDLDINGLNDQDTVMHMIAKYIVFNEIQDWSDSSKALELKQILGILKKNTSLDLSTVDINGNNVLSIFVKYYEYDKFGINPLVNEFIGNGNEMQPLTAMKGDSFFNSAALNLGVLNYPLTVSSGISNANGFPSTPLHEYILSIRDSESCSFDNIVTKDNFNTKVAGMRPLDLVNQIVLANKNLNLLTAFKEAVFNLGQSEYSKLWNAYTNDPSAPFTLMQLLQEKMSSDQILEYISNHSYVVSEIEENPIVLSLFNELGDEVFEAICSLPNALDRKDTLYQLYQIQNIKDDIKYAYISKLFGKLTAEQKRALNEYKGYGILQLEFEKMLSNSLGIDPLFYPNPEFNSMFVTERNKWTPLPTFDFVKGEVSKFIGKSIILATLTEIIGELNSNENVTLNRYSVETSNEFNIKMNFWKAIFNNEDRAHEFDFNGDIKGSIVTATLFDYCRNLFRNISASEKYDLIFYATVANKFTPTDTAIPFCSVNSKIFEDKAPILKALDNFGSHPQFLDFLTLTEDEKNRVFTYKEGVEKSVTVLHYALRMNTFNSLPDFVKIDLIDKLVTQDNLTLDLDGLPLSSVQNDTVATTAINNFVSGDLLGNIRNKALAAKQFAETAASSASEALTQVKAAQQLLLDELNISSDELNRAVEDIQKASTNASTAKDNASEQADISIVADISVARVASNLAVQASQLAESERDLAISRLESAIQLIISTAQQFANRALIEATASAAAALSSSDQATLDAPNSQEAVDAKTASDSASTAKEAVSAQVDISREATDASAAISAAKEASNQANIALAFSQSAATNAAKAALLVEDLPDIIPTTLPDLQNRALVYKERAEVAANSASEALTQARDAKQLLLNELNVSLDELNTAVEDIERASTNANTAKDSASEQADIAAEAIDIPTAQGAVNAVLQAAQLAESERDLAISGLASAIQLIISAAQQFANTALTAATASAEAALSSSDQATSDASDSQAAVDAKAASDSASAAKDAASAQVDISTSATDANTAISAAKEASNQASMALTFSQDAAAAAVLAKDFAQNLPQILRLRDEANASKGRADAAANSASEALTQVRDAKQLLLNELNISLDELSTSVDSIEEAATNANTAKDIAFEQADIAAGTMDLSTVQSAADLAYSKSEEAGAAKDLATSGLASAIQLIISASQQFANTALTAATASAEAALISSDQATLYAPNSQAAADAKTASDSASAAKDAVSAQVDISTSTTDESEAISAAKEASNQASIALTFSQNAAAAAVLAKSILDTAEGP